MRSLFVHIAPMLDSIIFTEQLRDKALLALEDAVVECRYRTVRPSYAVRFALAYLWIYGAGDRKPYDELWKVLIAEFRPWNSTMADDALSGVYRALHLSRPEAIKSDMWKRWQRWEGESGPSAKRRIR